MKNLVVAALIVVLASVGTASAAPRNMVSQCTTLEQTVTRHTASMKRLMKAKRKVSRAAVKNLRTAKNRYSLLCETGKRCGDVKQVDCASVGGDFCVQVIEERTFASMAELMNYGATYLYPGDCRTEGMNYGLPQYTGN